MCISCESNTWKTYDAVVGDVTILANRSKKVEFTVPYAESGLVIVQVSSEEPQKAWMFLKPFTMEMWVVTGALLIYTMFIVWVLDRTNPIIQHSEAHGGVSLGLLFGSPSLLFSLLIVSISISIKNGRDFGLLNN